MISPVVAVAACSAVSAAYVLSLYVWRPHPGGRQAPEVIARRMLSVACVSAVAWLPAAHFNRRHHEAAELLGKVGWGWVSSDG